MTEKWRQIQGKYNGTELEFVGELKLKLSEFKLPPFHCNVSFENFVGK